MVYSDYIKGGIAALFAAIFMIIFQSAVSNEPVSNSINEELIKLGYEQVKIYRNDFNRYEVDARLNGNHEIRLLINPMEGASLFNKHYLRLLGIEFRETGIPYKLGSGSDKLGIVTIDSIQIGNAKINSFDTRAIDFGNFKYLEEFFVEGFLGRDFLLKYHAIIDYGNEYIYLKTKK